MLKLEDNAMLIRAGIIPNIPIEEYHRHGSVSKSQLDQMAKSPAHYLASLTTPRKETPAMRIGSLFHGMLLEGVKVAVAPACDKRTKEGKAIFAEFESAHQGAAIVTADEGEMLFGMVKSVMEHTAARALLNGPGIAEGSCWWTDEQSGELCRCRPDFYREDLGVIVDLKSTEDASLEGFTRSVAKYNYATQAAFYSDGVAAATLKPVNGFVFIACEKSAPYAVQCFVLDFQAMEAGRITYMNLLIDLADCKHSGKFPAYSDAVETLSLPNWALRGVWE